MKKSTQELFLTGFLFGSAQVGTYFHLLLAEGGASILYFLLILVWLLGSLAGMFLPFKKELGTTYKLVCLLLFALSVIVCEFVQSLFFSCWMTFIVLLCAFSFGAYAGWFLQSRVERYKDAGFVLLYENNGFTLGYFTSAALLFLSSDFTNALVLVSGCLLLFYPEPGQKIQEQ
ncbi:MAG: hypothetical protein KIT34_18110 [Cyanobacteria bacterium TGS_CYA1]|nr:hypothetical protein [Cyanobacteria bacterium TGS_CYA1]